MKRAKLGEFEELVLLTVVALREDAYGLSVQQALRKEAQRPVELATVHSALYRLEKKGYVRSAMGGATQERGGRRKRLFEVTAAGLAVLDEVRLVREHMWNLIRSASA